MTTIAALAPEYDVSVLTALDLLGLEPGDADLELDSDREKQVREMLNTGGRATQAKGRIIRGGSEADPEADFISGFLDPDNPH